MSALYHVSGLGRPLCGSGRHETMSLTLARVRKLYVMGLLCSCCAADLGVDSRLTTRPEPEQLLDLYDRLSRARAKIQRLEAKLRKREESAT